MPPTTSYSFGDIVLVPFPVTDQTGTKKRPAVIVSSAAYNAARRDVVIMSVTSQARPTGAIGEIQVKDWKSAGLIKSSVIKSVVTTIEASLILCRLGQLKKEEQKSTKRSGRRSPRSSARTATPSARPGVGGSVSTFIRAWPVYSAALAGCLCPAQREQRHALFSIAPDWDAPLSCAIAYLIRGQYDYTGSKTGLARKPSKGSAAGGIAHAQGDGTVTARRNAPARCTIVAQRGGPRHASR
ncbi:MAG: type II toxin-antitoxin system PemK/MazF family toxin [Burkholderiales bacterium]